MVDWIVLRRRLTLVGLCLGTVPPVALAAMLLLTGETIGGQSDVSPACLWLGGLPSLYAFFAVATETRAARWIAFISQLAAIPGPIAYFSGMRSSLHGGEVFFLSQSIFAFSGAMVILAVIVWDVIRRFRRGRAGESSEASRTES